MKRLINSVPFLRLFLPFVLGIGVYINLEIEKVPIWVWGVFCILLLSFCFFVYNRWYKRNYALRGIDGLVAFCLLFLFGMLVSDWHRETNKSWHFTRMVDNRQPVFLQVRLLEAPVKKSNSWKADVWVEKIGNPTSEGKTGGRLMVYFKPKTGEPPPEYGDRVFVYGSLSEIVPPSNPNEFDYRRYLSFHQINRQLFAGPNHWELIEKGDFRNPLVAIARLRKHLSEVIQVYIIGENEMAIASALLLGIRDHLNDQIKFAYSGSGAMHVLAVSGLHVGIIFLFMTFLFRPLEKFKHGKWLSPIGLLACLWIYACLTGLAPSVLRASTMFSFIVVANWMQRSSNIYNTLLASATFLLLFNPFLLVQVGFQLSYLAVFGIVVLQPRIYNLFIVPNYLLDKAWALTAVSLAAQIATFPVGLLYFHQFPTFFLVSNLVVIPAASIILYSGMLLFLLSPFSSLAWIVGALLEFGISNLNAFLFAIDGLPNSLIQGIDITVWESWVIYAGIAFFCSYLISVYHRGLPLAFFCLFLILASNAWKSFQAEKRKDITFYSVRGHNAIQFDYGRNSLVLADAGLLQNPSKMLFHLKHNFWAKKLKTIEELPFESFQKMKGGSFQNGFLMAGDKMIDFSGIRLAVVDSALGFGFSGPKQEVELVFVTSGSTVQPKLLSSRFSFKTLILSSSIPEYKLKKWKDHCRDLLWDCRFLDSGALVIKEADEIMTKPENTKPQITGSFARSF